MPREKELSHNCKSFFDHLTCASNQSEEEADAEAQAQRAEEASAALLRQRLIAQRETGEGRGISGGDVWEIRLNRGTQ